MLIHKIKNSIISNIISYKLVLHDKKHIQKTVYRRPFVTTKPLRLQPKKEMLFILRNPDLFTHYNNKECPL